MLGIKFNSKLIFVWRQHVQKAKNEWCHLTEGLSVHEMRMKILFKWKKINEIETQSIPDISDNITYNALW